MKANALFFLLTTLLSFSAISQTQEFKVLNMREVEEILESMASDPEAYEYEYFVAEFDCKKCPPDCLCSPARTVTKGLGKKRFETIAASGTWDFYAKDLKDPSKPAILLKKDALLDGSNPQFELDTASFREIELQ